jgi:DNA-binding MurR/RpiR family transcriptional regulator
MKPSDEKLTPKQEAALLALLAHGTIDAAYEAAGVSKSTMWRFLQDATFQARYRAMRRQLVESAIGQLQATSHKGRDGLVRSGGRQRSPGISQGISSPHDHRTIFARRRVRGFERKS